MTTKGLKHSEETKQKIASALLGRKRDGGWKLSEETRKRQSDARKGKPLSESTKKKISEKLKGKKLSKETCLKMGESRKGNRNPSWKGGISYLPYCPKFNETFKEKVRGYYNHICPICGTTQNKNGRSLHVHHVDYNKQTCCDNSIPRFIALCDSCHSKTNHNRDYWRLFLGEHFKLFTP